jgi:hypothetical protein
MKLDCVDRMFLGLMVLVIVLCAWTLAFARDPGGRYANSPLHDWFNHLSSGKGLCCSMSDGEMVADVDWDSAGGHYRVRLEGRWVEVPDDAVITEPNRAGRTMVWPMHFDGEISIRCFMPGQMS